MTFDPETFRIKPGARVSLRKFSPDETGGLNKDDAVAEFTKLGKRLAELQELMYAQGQHAVLVVLQAMDAAGKDSTIRHVFTPVNPQGCHVISFKAPTQVERGHDYLWRIHQHVPAKGYLQVFNRSHYEDVLIVRVKKLVEKARLMKRYDHINAFEKMLADEGVTILKFFLHISKDHQKQQLQDRLDEPKKHWKFNPADLEERKLWPEYQLAFEEALSRCSTEHAPWYVVPAERKWFRNLLVSRVLVEKMTSLHMRHPKIDYDPTAIRIE